MKALARIFTILAISSLLVSGCGNTVFPNSPISTPLPPGILAIVPVAEGPIVLAATADAIWVESHREDIVTRIDPSQNKEVARLEDVPAHCTVTSGGEFVWAADAHQGKITKIDPATGSILGTIEILDPCGLAADNSDLWVTRPALAQAERYSVATLEKRAVIPLGNDTFFIEIGPDAVWAVGEADGGTVWRIDPATNQVVTAINISDPLPVGLIIAFDSVWIGSRTKGVIYRIDPATNTIIQTIKVNNAIGGIGVGLDAIWASGFGDGKIYRIDPATNSVSGTLSTRFWNLGPPLVAFESIWVGALDQNVVLRIDPGAFHSSDANTP
jgi:DNA-binding beta-propeller fold protein YncE